jgi:hypothetical protein
MEYIVALFVVFFCVFEAVVRVIWLVAGTVRNRKRVAMEIALLLVSASVAALFISSRA